MHSMLAALVPNVLATLALTLTERRGITWSKVARLLEVSPKSMRTSAGEGPIAHGGADVGGPEGRRVATGFHQLVYRVRRRRGRKGG